VFSQNLILNLGLFLAFFSKIQAKKKIMFFLGETPPDRQGLAGLEGPTEPSPKPIYL
jgi:hypothetical protein